MGAAVFDWKLHLRTELGFWELGVLENGCWSWFSGGLLRKVEDGREWNGRSSIWVQVIGAFGRIVLE